VRFLRHNQHQTTARMITMSTPSPFKALSILVLTIVLLCVGLVIGIGLFGLLIKLFSHA
jgi:hypothetical protein